MTNYVRQPLYICVKLLYLHRITVWHGVFVRVNNRESG